MRQRNCASNLNQLSRRSSSQPRSLFGLVIGRSLAPLATYNESLRQQYTTTECAGELEDLTCASTAVCNPETEYITSPAYDVPTTSVARAAGTRRIPWRWYPGGTGISAVHARFDIAAPLTLKAYFLPLTSLALLSYRQKAVALDVAEKAIAAPSTSYAAIELI